MRRQKKTGGYAPAGSSRVLRLDPHTLPTKIFAADAAADGARRVVEIDRERVLVLRSVRGVRMRLNLPLEIFLGVALRAVPGETGAVRAVALVLEHRDPALSVQLRLAGPANDAMLEGRRWAETLGCPLLTADAGAPAGASAIRMPAPRRRRRTALKHRRPTIFGRRMWGKVRIPMRVHRDEREIIAPE